jgi:hypothetical protein
MARNFHVSRNGSVTTIAVENATSIPGKVQEFMLGFSVGLSWNGGTVQYEIPMDTESDEELVKELRDILSENGWIDTGEE